MPSVTITLTDTPDCKGIECDCSLDLRPGQTLSLAQLAAAEIMLRTNKEWNLKAHRALHVPALGIDAVPRHHNNAVEVQP